MINMPGYKSHLVHGELLFNKINKKIDLNKEELKDNCAGPDAFMITDYKTFMMQHSCKTKEFFETLLKFIKINKLYDNPHVMSFLYGQIDHFALDTTLHPFIYYISEGYKNGIILKSHALIEMWIDDYITFKYLKNRETKINSLTVDKTLKELIDSIYKKVYNLKDAGLKYNTGIYFNKVINSLRNPTTLNKFLIKTLKTGDFISKKNILRVIPFLNKRHELWKNPETNKEYTSSFDELWLKSLIISEELIREANNHIYNDLSINNSLLMKDLSYDTALPCIRKQTLKYIKKY